MWGKRLRAAFNFCQTLSGLLYDGICVGLTFFGERFSYSGLQPKQPVGKRFFDHFNCYPRLSNKESMAKTCREKIF